MSANSPKMPPPWTEHFAAQRDLDLALAHDVHDLAVIAGRKKTVPGGVMLRVEVAGKHRKIGHDGAFRCGKGILRRKRRVAHV